MTLKPVAELWRPMPIEIDGRCGTKATHPKKKDKSQVRGKYACKQSKRNQRKFYNFCLNITALMTK